VTGLTRPLAVKVDHPETGELVPRVLALLYLVQNSLDIQSSGSARISELILILKQTSLAPAAVR
jgi:hypothetical protein